MATAQSNWTTTVCVLKQLLLRMKQRRLRLSLLGPALNSSWSAARRTPARGLASTLTEGAGIQHHPHTNRTELDFFLAEAHLWLLYGFIIRLIGVLIQSALKCFPRIYLAWECEAWCGAITPRCVVRALHPWHWKLALKTSPSKIFEVILCCVLGWKIA